MTDRTPDFSELVGDVDPDERARLEQVHNAIVTAGPMPELPLALQKAPEMDDRHDAAVAFSFLPRRGGRILTLAAGFALLCLVVGYVIGNHRTGFTTVQTVPMRGTADAPNAFGLVKVAKRDANGNFPLEVSVTGLRALPTKSYYVLYLVKGGKNAAICGSFLVRNGQTTVRMSAPYDFKKYDGWTVAVYTAGHRKAGPALLASTNAV